MKNFIYVKENAVPAHVCESVIEFFEKNQELHHAGNVCDMHGKIDVNSVDKISTDLGVTIDVNDLFLQLMIEILHDCLEEYKKEYEFLNVLYAWKIDDSYNIQKYKPGEGYRVWHCESNGPVFPSTHRILAWMIYLNDVPDGGTEFNYDFGSLEAKTGTLAIWPAYWTHFHRGIVSNTTTKYIATGWFSYVKQ